jgi:hypothetical protein
VYFFVFNNDYALPFLFFFYASRMEVKRSFSQLDLLSTPEPVRAYIIHLERMISQMQQRLELVEKRTG